MKANYLIPAVVILGITVLFFSPEPETNFFAYARTALFFIILTIVLIVWQRRKRR